MKKILVPTDFSPHSLKAVLYAKSLAISIDAELILLHIQNEAEGVHGRRMSIQEFKEKFSTTQSASFATFINKLEQKVPISEQKEFSFEYWQKDAERITNTILKFIDDQEIDLLIVGTKGASGIREKLFGTRAGNIIDRVSCPVIAVTKKSIYSSIEKIYYATNLDRTNENRIKVIADFADSLKAQLHFVYIKTEERKSFKRKHEDFKLWISEILGKEDFNIAIQNSETVLIGLHEFTELNEVQMLVMIQNENKSLDDFFTISFTRKMAFNGDVPVLIFKE